MADAGNFGARRRLARGLAVAAGGIAVSVALIGVALAGGLLGGRRDGAAPAGPAPEPSVAYSGCASAPQPSSAAAVMCVPRFEMTPSPDYGTTATPSVPPLEYNKAQIARLGAAFEKHLRAVAPPRTTFLDTRVNGDAAGPFEFSVLNSGRPDNGGRYAEGFTVGPDLRDPSGTGNVVFSIGKPISAVAPDGRPWPPGYGVGQFRTCPDPDCNQTTGPRGEQIVAMPHFQNDHGAKIARIDVTKPDGTGIVFEVRNWGLGNTGEQTTPKLRPEFSLTLHQMIEIATDPALTMTP